MLHAQKTVVYSNITSESNFPKVTLISLNLNLAYMGTFIPTFFSNCGKNLEKVEVLKERSFKPKSVFQLF